MAVHAMAFRLNQHEGGHSTSTRPAVQMKQANMEAVIEKLIIGGKGLGYLSDGKVVMVSGVLPGETVRFRPVRIRKQLIEGELLEVLIPSADRAKASCPVFETCGGCDFQHISQIAQAEYKQAILEDHLSRSGLFSQENIAAFLQSPAAARDLLGYRQRIRLQVDRRTGTLGYFRARSHSIQAIRACPIARPEINRVLEKMHGSASLSHLLHETQELELLLSPDDGMLILLFHHRRKPRPADEAAAKDLVETVAGIKSISFTVKGYAMFGPYGAVAERSESSVVLDNVLRITLSADLIGKSIGMALEPGGFCQVNLRQNETLIRQFLEWARCSKEERALDLFCGMGNFSIPLAFSAGEVLGADLQGSAVRSAKANAVAAGLSNCRFVKSSAVDFARELLRTGDSFPLILLDPPRSGCAEVIPLVAGLATKRIIYVSCDPATLVRDLGHLQRIGLRVRAMRMIDMFPQTHHMETITLLEKKGMPDSI